MVALLRRASSSAALTLGVVSLPSVFAPKAAMSRVATSRAVANLSERIDVRQMVAMMGLRKDFMSVIVWVTTANGESVGLRWSGV